MTVPRLSRIPWPPILYVAAALAGLKLGDVLPLAWWPTSAAVQLLGLALLGAAVGIDVWAMVTMARQRANILPNRAATALVTAGPFRWSRNPIYLGNTVMVGSFALAFDAPWCIPFALLAALAVNHLAIRREEAHVAALFGQAWADYAARTNRWFGRRG